MGDKAGKVSWRSLGDRTSTLLLVNEKPGKASDFVRVVEEVMQ